MAKFRISKVLTVTLYIVQHENDYDDNKCNISHIFSTSDEAYAYRESEGGKFSHMYVTEKEMKFDLNDDSDDD